MKSQLHFCFISFFIINLLALSHPVLGSHAAGGEISYTHLNGNNYQIRLVIYRDCMGIPAPASVTVDIVSAQCSLSIPLTLLPIPGTGQEITFTCPGVLTTCQGGTQPGIEKWEYESAYSFPAQCADWIISHSTCCRNAAITTLQSPGAENIYLEARLNNLAGDNSSPQFTVDPQIFLCTGQPFQYNNGMIDPDGDSLAYSMVAPRSSPNTDVTYNPGYSSQVPVSSNPPAIFLPITGDFIVHPTTIEVGVLAFQVMEYRNGVLIGTVIRDINIYTIPCTNYNPAVTGINGTSQLSVPVMPDSTICFNVFTSDPDTGDSLSLQWNNGIPAGYFYSSGGSSPTGVFCWTPTQADVRSQPYSFTVTVRDDNCPSNGTSTQSYFMYVSTDSSFVNLTNLHPWKIYAGNVYWDSNSNGQKDSAEVDIPNQPIKLLPEDVVHFTDSNGDFEHITWYYQTHSLTVLPPAGWLITSDSISYTIPDTMDHSGLDFGMNALTSFNYIDVNLSGGIPRCNNAVNYWITYENLGSTLANGRVTFIMDSAVSFNSSTPIPDLISGDSLFYNFTNLFPFSTGQIMLSLNLPGPGDTLHFAVLVEYDSLGVYYLSGEQALQQIVVCSFDPNDKTVLPEGLYNDHWTLYNDTLLYTIRFQNTGTDTAFTVFVQDFVDPSLDLATFHVTGSSHPVTTSIFPNRMVEFRFENILLPDSNVNEPESNGFVQYRISPLTNLSLPVIVTNNANIFFDSNFPVLTNTVSNTLVPDLYVTVPSSREREFSAVIPNPFHHEAMLMLGDAFRNSEAELRVMNALGELVFEKSTKSNVIQISRGRLVTGIYFYEVRSRDGKRVTGKFLVQ